MDQPWLLHNATIKYIAVVHHDDASTHLAHSGVVDCPPKDLIPEYHISSQEKIPSTTNNMPLLTSP
jgi:hypothetical protein